METAPYMKVTLRIVTCLALCAASARAEFPSEDMGPRILGLQYGLGFRGQSITEAQAPSHEIMHALTLGYSPIPYVTVEVGAGIDKLSVDTHNGVGFRGDYGFSPNFGLILSSPYLLELVRAVGGARFLVLNSEDERGFAYTGLISNPFLGASVSPSVFFDCEAGMRMHTIDGTMKGPGRNSLAFSNSEIVRGYAAFTVKAPAEHVFLTLDLDASPSLDSDWSDGPREAAVRVSFGALLGWRGKSGAVRDSSAYFPAYHEMKERQKKMAEEIE